MNHKYKYRSVVLTVICVLALVSHSHAVTIDRIAAVVNGEIITKSDIDTLLFEKFNNVPLAKIKKEKKAFFLKAQRESLEYLLESKLLLGEAAREGVSVTPETVNSQILKMLKVKDIKAAKEILNREGLDLASLQERIRVGLILRRFAYKKGFNDVSVSSKEVDSYFKAHTEDFPDDEIVDLKNIVFRVPKESSSASWEEYKEVGEEKLTKLKKSKTNVLDAKPIASNTYKLSKLSDSVRSAIVGLNEGEWTPLLKMPYGYIAFSIVKREHLSPKNDKKINDKIINELSFQKSSQRRKAFIKTLKNKANIEILF